MRQGRRAAAPVALPVVEAVPREEAFYDFESRYEIGQTTFVCPAQLPRETTAQAQEMALAAYRLLGCHGFARVDLMLDQESGELTVLEVNVVPGLTETSLLPQAADAAGIGFDELVERMLARAQVSRDYGVPAPSGLYEAADATRSRRRRSPRGRPGRGTP